MKRTPRRRRMDRFWPKLAAWLKFDLVPAMSGAGCQRGMPSGPSRMLSHASIQPVRSSSA